MTTQHSRLVQRNGVEYLIRIEKTAGGCCGTWLCLKCHQSGISDPSDDSLDVLAMATEDQAAREHGPAHTRSSGAA